MSENKLKVIIIVQIRSNKSQTMEVTIKLEDSDECENIIELEFIGLVTGWWWETVGEEVT